MGDSSCYSTALIPPTCIRSFGRTTIAPWVLPSRRIPITLFPHFMLGNASLSCTHFMDNCRLHSLNPVIKNALANLYPEPWLPNLTAPLVAWGDQVLRCRTGIMPADYGTARVLAESVTAPQHIGARLPAGIAANGSAREITIEFLTEAYIGSYRNIGLGFYTPDEVANTTVLQCLQDAIDVLGQVPTLQTTVAVLIRTCHLLKPEYDTCDVSHSDPHVPFSVFVSVPRNLDPTDVLRVAESLTHEAMHLQLTLIERLLPLVEESEQMFYSPWKATERPLSGILHALYVFRAIDSFLERLLARPGWSIVCVDHMRRRRCEIAQQIWEVRAFKNHPGLTEIGTRVAGLLVGDWRCGGAEEVLCHGAEFGLRKN